MGDKTEECIAKPWDKSCAQTTRGNEWCAAALKIQQKKETCCRFDN